MLRRRLSGAAPETPMTARSLALICAPALLCATLLAGCASTPPGPSVALLEPADGATVSSPFMVRFGVSGMAIAPAGQVAEGTGHHHLLINKGAMPAGTPIPADATHLHFGKGQTEAEVKLAPGTYTLTAQFANGLHESYGPAMSRTITIMVK